MTKNHNTMVKNIRQLKELDTSLGRIINYGKIQNIAHQIKNAKKLESVIIGGRTYDKWLSEYQYGFRIYPENRIPIYGKGSEEAEKYIKANPFDYIFIQ